jgi:release factor glutamine methyltransferase
MIASGLTIRTALLQGVKLLEDAGVDTPRLTAEILLGYAVGGKPKEWLYAHAGDELIELWWIHYGRYLHQRIEGMPTQYITRRQEFYGREFRLSPAVLIPRPETEHLVEAALARVAKGSRVVDVGTGSGAIAVTIALEKRVRVVASDVSVEALAVARDNATRLSAEVLFLQSDLLTAFASASVDVLVSNPPYIAEGVVLQREVQEHEPHLALFSGSDGLGHYRRLIDDAARVVVPGGWLLMEMGWDSAIPVRVMLERGWEDVAFVADLAGIDRVVVARRVAR